MTNTDTTLIPDQRDLMSRDDVLIAWQTAKSTLEHAKAEEMEWRKYVVKRAFPSASEGINNFDLGEGKTLKAGIKYNYNLLSNKIVEQTLNDIKQIGNDGPFIAERLCSVTYNFLLTEYRQLQEQAKEGSIVAQQILDKVSQMLEIKEVAPSLEIKEKKVKK